MPNLIAASVAARKAGAEADTAADAIRSVVAAAEAASVGAADSDEVAMKAVARAETELAQAEAVAARAKEAASEAAAEAEVIFAKVAEVQAAVERGEMQAEEAERIVPEIVRMAVAVTVRMDEALISARNVVKASGEELALRMGAKQAETNARSAANALAGAPDLLAGKRRGGVTLSKEQAEGVITGLGASRTATASREAVQATVTAGKASVESKVVDEVKQIGVAEKALERAAKEVVSTKEAETELAEDKPLKGPTGRAVKAAEEVAEIARKAVDASRAVRGLRVRAAIAAAGVSINVATMESKIRRSTVKAPEAPGDAPQTMIKQGLIQTIREVEAPEAAGAVEELLRPGAPKVNAGFKATADFSEEAAREAVQAVALAARAVREAVDAGTKAEVAVEALREAATAPSPPPPPSSTSEAAEVKKQRRHAIVLAPQDAAKLAANIQEQLRMKAVLSHAKHEAEPEVLSDNLKSDRQQSKSI